MPPQQPTGGITTADWPQEALSDPALADLRRKPMLDHGMNTGVRVTGMSAVSADK
jgi:hypothetical protein